jgi:hypothetical protein
MSSVRSFVVRIYRRRGGGELSGTLEVVDGRPAGRQPGPLAFASEAELVRLMHGERPPAPRRDRAGQGRG